MRLKTLIDTILLTVGFGLSLLLLVMFITTFAHMGGALGAEAPGHALHHSDFYKGLVMSDDQTSCCDDNDCGPTQGWRYDPKTNEYSIKILGEWFTPPQYVIQHKVTPDGGAHACYDQSFKPGSENYYPDGTLWYCVIIPKGLF